MMKLMRGAALALVISATAGCVNGQLTPTGAAVIRAIDLSACAVLEARLPTEAGRVVGDVCAADKPLLDLVLGVLVASKLATLTPAPTDPRPAVRCGGRAIGHVDAVLAPKVQAGLDAQAACAAR